MLTYNRILLVHAGPRLKVTVNIWRLEWTSWSPASSGVNAGMFLAIRLRSLSVTPCAVSGFLVSLYFSDRFILVPFKWASSLRFLRQIRLTLY